jgi:hypothetical protein
MMTDAVIQPSTRTQRGLANSPIRARWLVNCNRGTTAKGNCKLRTTWLATSKFVIWLAPKKRIVKSAGTIATSRVTRRRIQGRMRKFRKPSITTWPAKVPVRVEL